MLRSILALIRKDLTISLRNPTFLAISIVVPLVFVTAYALVIQVAATNPIVIARESHGPYSDTFVEILQDMTSVDGPFFEIRTVDPAVARAKYHAREAIGLLEIPASFDQRLAVGTDATVELQVFNINSDGTKNLQLRVDHAVYAFQQRYHPSGTITVREISIFDQDMQITQYLGTALLMFSVIYAAMVNTGSLIAREWEERTAKLVVLSPYGYWPFVVSKWGAALVQTIASLGFILLILYIVLGYPVTDLSALDWLYLLSFFLYGAAFGVLLGILLRSSLPIVPVCAVVGVTHFFLSGYESYIRGFAYGGALEWLWWMSSWLPIATLTDHIRFSVAGMSEHVIAWQQIGWMLLLISMLTAVAIRSLSKKLRFRQGQ